MIAGGNHTMIYMTPPYVYVVETKKEPIPWDRFFPF